MNKVQIYTDGACSGNPGPGGYAAVLLLPNGVFEISGSVEMTTNNRMEIAAAIEALNAVPQRSAITLYSDSTYVVSAFRKGWLKGWIARKWLKSDGSNVPNADLWQNLVAAVNRHISVEFRWLRGHSGHVYNDHADLLARAAVSGRVTALRPLSAGRIVGRSRTANFTSVRF